MTTSAQGLSLSIVFVCVCALVTIAYTNAATQTHSFHCQNCNNIDCLLQCRRSHSSTLHNFVAFELLCFFTGAAAAFVAHKRYTLLQRRIELRLQHQIAETI